MKQRAVGASLELAVRHYREGQREDARRVCGQILGRNPRDAQALYLLGLLELEAGNHDAAVQRLERAVALSPNSAPFLCNLGLAYARTQALDKARETLSRALELDPNLAEALFNLGLVQLDRGELGDALRHLQRAAEQRPSSFGIQRALARALLRAGRGEDAVARFRSALRLSPESLETKFELLSALYKHGSTGDAALMARGLVEQNPELAEAHFRLGQVLSKQEELDAAIASLERALTLDAAHAPCRRELALLLLKLGCLEEAFVHLERAVELDPMAQHAHSRLVFHSAFHPKYTAERILETARRFDASHTAALAAQRLPLTNERSPERRLRVGYVSPDFRDHAQRLFTFPLLREHDHEAFEIVCYSSANPEDAWTERLKSCADLWRSVTALGASDLARLIRDDQVDILVDLSMHMDGHRLKVFAQKPAPVQLAWLAYPGTTGVDGIDYRVTDPYLDPPGAPLPYSEQTLWLPHSFWCYDPQAEEPAVNELPAQGAGHITFGCLNNFLKANAGVFELWARVLTQVPGSKFLLLAPSERARVMARRAFEGNGVDPARLEFVGLQWRKDYLATYHRIDVALDCVPYNGHTTSLDAFWMGVPVVTLVGNTVAGRAGLCQAYNLKLPELVADSSADFVLKAVALTRDLPRLAALRRELRSRLRKSPLMDAPRFTRDLEALYRNAWRRWCGP